MPSLSTSGRELNTIIAALQIVREGNRDVLEAMDHFDEYSPLSDEEIERLVARLKDWPAVQHREAQAIAPLVDYAAAGPASHPGDGFWKDLASSFACGERSEQFEAAKRIRVALAALGIEAPAGRTLCGGCSCFEADAEHDPDCSRTRDAESEDGDESEPHAGTQGIITDEIDLEIEGRRPNLPPALLESAIQDQGYRVTTREAFLHEPIDICAYHGATAITGDEIAAEHAEILAGLRDRVQKYEGPYVVYDPSGDAEGWLLVGERAEIVRLTHSMLEDLAD